jgi:energy-coupling factor transporter ATP-binding protein EcfA2
MVITGPAGCGKTTLVQALALLYLAHNPDQVTEYRVKGQATFVNAPKFAIIAFTNRATNNMAAKLKVHPVLGSDFGYNVTTGHNLIQYTVEFIVDQETGDTKRHYYPLKDQFDKLDIDYLVVEEATMIGVGNKSLWAEIFAALPSHTRIIFLGDINQLPPVIGKPVLSYALQSPDFEVIELKTIHRTALENPIINQAHRWLAGKPIETELKVINGETTGVKLFTGKAKIKLPAHTFERKAIEVLMHYMAEGFYNPMEDMVLSPYNKPSEHSITAQNLAKYIATELATQQGRKVYEVIAGFVKDYYSIGDRVYFEKEEGVITNITNNTAYMGKIPKEPSTSLTYFGKYNGSAAAESDSLDFDFLDSDSALPDENFALDLSKLEDQDQDADSKEERKRTASHTIEITLADERVVTCNTVGDFAELQLGYALSVHKAQGSEWPNVFLVLHDTNNVMLFRELVYTGMTRPQKFLGIIAQQHVIDKAQAAQRIKGNSLADKIEFFNGGYLDQDVPLNPATDGAQA